MAPNTEAKQRLGRRLQRVGVGVGVLLSALFMGAGAMQPGGLTWGDIMLGAVGCGGATLIGRAARYVLARE